MTIYQLSILILIGLSAGILSGFVGVGGGIIMVPALIYILGMGQFEAQGTSIAVMLLPIGILAAYNYYKADQLNIPFALVIAATFVVGGYFGSKFSLSLPADTVKLIFGIIMLIVAIKMILSGIKFHS